MTNGSSAPNGEQATKPSGRRSAAAAMVVVFLVLVAGIGGIHIIRPTPAMGKQVEDIASPNQDSIMIDCKLNDTGGSSDCTKYLRDAERRGSLDSGQREKLQGLQFVILSKILSATQDPPCDVNATQGCETFAPAGYPSRIATSLTRAGFADHVVRIARADDPVRMGDILAVVHIGSGCILYNFGQGTQRISVLGTLADGRCIEA